MRCRALAAALQGARLALLVRDDLRNRGPGGRAGTDPRPGGDGRRARRRGRDSGARG